jgi:hypothetical protein
MKIDIFISFVMKIVIIIEINVINYVINDEAHLIYSLYVVIIIEVMSTLYYFL